MKPREIDELAQAAAEGWHMKEREVSKLGRAFQSLNYECDELRRLLEECTCADPACPAHGDDPFTLEPVPA